MNIAARLRQAEEKVERSSPKAVTKWYRVSYGLGGKEAAKQVAREAGWRDDGTDGLIMIEFVSPPSQPPYTEPARMLP